MKSVIRLIALCAAGFLISFSADTVFGKQAIPEDLNKLEIRRLHPEKFHKRTLLEVMHNLNFSHYQQHQLNDELSRWLLGEYVNLLDPNHNFFYQSDISRFKEYENLLDDAIRNGNLKPSFDIYNTYQQRSVERLLYIIKLVSKNYASLDFNKDEYLEQDRSEQPWPKTKSEMRSLWRKQVKSSILALKLTDKPDDEIATILEKRYRNKLNRIVQTTSEDVFQKFTNTLTSLYDPHTEYLSPRASDNFNINMSLSLEGIGAVLQNEDEYTKVVRLVPGGPADKSKLLHPEDRIVSVGQGDSKLVDVVGWRIGQVVELIRGRKGSYVSLEIIPSNQKTNLTKTIKIRRNTVQLEDKAAHADILYKSVNNNKLPIGVINIPAFYADFKGQQQGKKNYRRTSSDLTKLLHKLNKQKIQGLIIDLRNNGGGSLLEANRTLGLFIKSGPTVQVKDSLNRIDLHHDKDPSIIYKGPLIVMVNRLSASASEIFAGAIQDYQRGIIVGSRTFGKGTVQALRALDHGQLKITQNKFYRISGGSNQHMGIVPDISFPSQFDPEEIGESALDNALPWDTISPARYNPYAQLREYVPMLEKNHLKRIAKDPDFQHLLQQVALIEDIKSRKQISLSEKVRRKEVTETQAKQLALENDRRKRKNEPLFKDIEALEEDLEKKREASRDDVIRDDDVELQAAGNILIDLIKASVTRMAGN